MADKATRKAVAPGGRPGEKCRVSVVIPNRNGAETIGRCLDSLFASEHDSFEVIVVDDCSRDDSMAIINRFPCKLAEMNRHSGAAAARNFGDALSRGEIIFFTDADCLVLPETLAIAEAAARQHGPGTILGGTYTCRPDEEKFFSIFQSVFINYSELKNPENPDYIATHAMVVHASVFRSSGGFNELLPLLEDVEYSHRLRRDGYQLRMTEGLLVEHVFNYDLAGSLRNAYRKSRFWIVYSIANRDLLKDSGTASFELKINVLLFTALLLLSLAWLKFPEAIPLAALPAVLMINCMVNQRLMSLFWRTGGPLFAVNAASYYMLIFPLAVLGGALSGLLNIRKLFFVNTAFSNR